MIAFSLLPGGCAGTGRVTVVPMNFKKISTAAPLLERLDAGECHFWQDEKGRLCVAMAGENLSLIGDYGKRSMALSLVLDAPPAGKARNYSVNTGHLRMTARTGANHKRWASLSGIVAVWQEHAGHLRGRFRILAKQQRFHITTGWAANARVLLTGEFNAVPNPKRGQSILEKTEANGMERNPSR